MRTNLQLSATYGLDEDALNYCATHSVSNIADMLSISRCVQILKAGNVWGNLVDFHLLWTNANNSTLATATTYAGVVPNIKGTTPVYDSRGVTFTHGGNHVLWMTNFPDMRTNTIFVQATHYAVNWATAGGTFVLQNQDTSGSFTAPASYFAMGVLNSGNSGVQWRQGNGASFTWSTLSDHHRLNGLGIAGTRVSDYARIYVSGLSNLTWKAWMENIPAGNGNTTEVLGDTVNAMTTPLTNIFLGGIITAPNTFQSWGQTIRCWFAFNICMSQAQVECVNRAMRALDPQKKNVVFFGDSRFAGESFDFAGAVGDQRGCIVNKMMNELGSASARFYNMAVPSITAEQCNTDSILNPRTIFYAPDGVSVVQTDVHLLPGACNNFYNVGGATVLSTFNTVSNVCSKLKAAGCDVYLWTECPIATQNYSTNIPGGASFTNFATQYNILLATNAGIADVLVRYDLSMMDWQRLTNANLFTDGIHPTAAGNQWIANFVRKQLTGQLGGIENMRGATTNVSALSAITLTFRVPFPGTNYAVTATSGNGASALANVFVSSKTAASCVLNFTAFTGAVDWIATYQTQTQ